VGALKLPGSTRAMQAWPIAEGMHTSVVVVRQRNVIKHE
jgi:hypothetical protein